MAEQAKAGVSPQSDSDALLTAAKQQLGLLPPDEASLQHTPALQGFTHSSLSSNPGFSSPDTPAIPQARITASAAGSMDSTPASQASTPLPPPPGHRDHTALQHTAQQQQPQQQPQQQHPQVYAQRQDTSAGQHPAHVQHASQQQTTGIALRDWQGPLIVVNHKGEELICDLMTDQWPAHLPR